MEQSSQKLLQDGLASDDFCLQKFGKHTPRILRKQLMATLVKQYLCGSIGDSQTSGLSEGLTCQSCCIPSIERFHGALLFVDISGFTILSQRLDVEDLKTHINAYFKKILDVIEKYDGEVVKFAGDALFVIWQSKTTNLDNLKDASQAVVERAAICGREINLTCSDYKINLDKNDNTGNSSLDQINSSMGARPTTHAGRRSTIDTDKGKEEDQKNKSGRISNRKVSNARNNQNSVRTVNSSIRKKNDENNKVTYLNVHSGLSVGVMAGLDIGAKDRWEYLLVGEPLAHVAIAEGDAKKGELVISDIAHEYLHPKNTESITQSAIIESENGLAGTPKNSKSKSTQRLSCGCLLTASKYYVLHPKKFNASCAISTKSVDEAEDALNAEFDLKFYGEILSDISKAYQFILPILKNQHQVSNAREFDNATVTQQPFRKRSTQNRKKSFQKSSFALLTSQMPVDGVTEDEAMQKMLTNAQMLQDSMETEQIFNHFLKLSQNCVVDDIARHVHEVARDNYEFRFEDRKSLSYKSLLDQSLLVVKKNRNSFTSSLSAFGATGNQITTGNVTNKRIIAAARSSANASGSLNIRSNVEEKIKEDKGGQYNSSKSKRDGNDRDSIFSAELRSVIVLFVKLEIRKAELLFSPTQEEICPIDKIYHVESFHFLNRSVQEYEADQELLMKFQRCMEIVTTCFMDKGGQLRQFIVDDKGTVCIGTFGLRGSMTMDNAAAANDAAQSIVQQISGIGLTASIGVTSGKGYCGLVGSRNRHEYAVMGPSTNLSARLMCKAQPGEIICDQETRNRDRAHNFVPLAELQAKGFSAPVPTFRPVLKVTKISRSAMIGTLGDLPKDYRKSYKMLLSPQYSTTMLKMPSIRNSNGVAQHDPNRIASIANTQTNDESSRRKPNERVSGRRRPSISVKRTPKLFGRESELRQIFEFIFPKIPIDNIRSHKPFSHDDPMNMHRRKSSFFYNSSTKFFSPSDFEKVDVVATGGNETTNPHEPDSKRILFPFKKHFSIEDPAKFVVIQGTHGVGKTAFLNEVFKLVSNLIVNKNDILREEYNVALFQNRAKQSNMKEAFFVWKAIFRRMFNDVGQLVTKSSASSSAEANGDVHGEGILLQCGIDKIFSMLPPDLQQLRSLLKAVDLNDSNSNNSMSNGTSILQDHPKNENILDLFQAIIQQYILFTNNLVILLIDNLHSVDSASTQLLSRLWSNTTGFYLISCFRIMPKFATESYINVNNEFLESLQESKERFRLIELGLLKLEDIRSLANDILSFVAVQEIADNTVYEKLFEMCGGNPLYGSELVHAFSKKRVVDKHQEQSVFAENFVELVKDFKSSRIEEVICYRFDQLDANSQLFLKMATVACSNESAFNIYMLHYMMADNDGDAVLECDHDSLIESIRNRKGSIYRIIANLQEILRRDEFINVASYEASDLVNKKGNNTIKKLLESSDDEDDANDSIGFLNHDQIFNEEEYLFMTYEFKIWVEQTTIYEIMLNKQRLYLHERLAAYLRKQNSTCLSNDGFSKHVISNRVLAFSEEGFHWERSHNYPQAMECYYQCVLLLRQKDNGLGSTTTTSGEEEGEDESTDVERMQYLYRAFKIFQLILFEAGVSEDHTDIDESTNSKEHQRVASLSLADSSNPPMQKLIDLNYNDLCGLFHNNNRTLEVALAVILEMSHSYFMMDHEFISVNYLLDEALHIIQLLAKNSSLPSGEMSMLESDIHSFSTMTTAEPVHSPTRIPSETRSTHGGGGGKGGGSPTLSLHEMNATMCFAILSDIIHVCQLNLRNNPKFLEDKLDDIIKLYLSIARSSLRYVPYLLVGYSHVCVRKVDIGELEASMEWSKVILEWYDVAEHHTTLAQHQYFLYDPIPATFIIQCKGFIVRNLEKELQDTIKLVMSWLGEIHHSHTLMITSVGLASLYVLMHSTTEATRTITRCHTWHAERDMKIIFPEAIQILFHEWISLTTKFYDSSSSVVTRRAFHVFKKDATDLYGDMIDKHFLFPTFKSSSIIPTPTSSNVVHIHLKKPFLWELLDFIGIGSDFMCSFLLLQRCMILHAKLSEDEDDDIMTEILDGVQLALQYLEITSLFQSSHMVNTTAVSPPVDSVGEKDSTKRSFMIQQYNILNELYLLTEIMEFALVLLHSVSKDRQIELINRYSFFGHSYGQILMDYFIRSVLNCHFGLQNTYLGLVLNDSNPNNARMKKGLLEFSKNNESSHGTIPTVVHQEKGLNRFFSGVSKVWNEADKREVMKSFKTFFPRLFETHSI